MCSVRILMLLTSWGCSWLNMFLLEKETDSLKTNSHWRFISKSSFQGILHSPLLRCRLESWGEARHSIRRGEVQSVDRDSCWEELPTNLGSHHGSFFWQPICSHAGLPASGGGGPSFLFACHPLREGLPDFSSRLGLPDSCSLFSLWSLWSRPPPPPSSSHHC